MRRIRFDSVYYGLGKTIARHRIRYRSGSEVKPQRNGEFRQRAIVAAHGESRRVQRHNRPSCFVGPIKKELAAPIDLISDDGLLAYHRPIVTGFRLTILPSRVMNRHDRNPDQENKMITDTIENGAPAHQATAKIKAEVGQEGQAREESDVGQRQLSPKQTAPTRRPRSSRS